MIRLFAFLWTGCFHKWVEDRRYSLKLSSATIPHGEAIICHCERCGRPKRFDLT